MKHEKVLEKMRDIPRGKGDASGKTKNSQLKEKKITRDRDGKQDTSGLT